MGRECKLCRGETNGNDCTKCLITVTHLLRILRTARGRFLLVALLLSGCATHTRAHTLTDPDGETLDVVEIRKGRRVTTCTLTDGIVTGCEVRRG